GFSNFVIYIPHRHDEGFGLNEGAVAELATAGVQLIITIDCGITDVLPVARANQLGLDVIITDHHEPPLELPQAYAIVDHKQGGCPYPDKDLCGSGVAYKLIQAILKKNRFGLKDGMEKWLLDLVGMATLSDMVPLVGENRVLARYGLDVLRKSRRRGLMRLFDKLKIPQKHITEDDIAFMITPRINAASRMGVPMDAFRLLAAETDDEAHMYADHLDAVNNERKGVVASLVKEVKNIVKERHGSAIPSVIVLGNPAWRPSLLGLAAHSCAEEFRRPVFLWGRDGDNAIKGSCRSEGDSNVVEIMRAVPAGIFEQFGGHRHSGGFTVANDAVHYLEQKLNEAAEGNIIRNSGLKPEENADDMVDAEMKFADITADLFNDIHQLAPFGVGNPKPVFLFRNVAPLRVRTFGKSGDHVELVFKSAAAGFGGAISAISFFGAASDWAANVKANQPVDLVASLEKSLFRGRAELRLRIVDVEVC
ncbi:MAG: hypothetical protein KGI59_03115, partial [Patescibacteria group bacterium]|nr:hypothetical protein [Patescibacteria group bacterium]